MPASGVARAAHEGTATILELAGTLPILQRAALTEDYLAKGIADRASPELRELATLD